MKLRIKDHPYWSLNPGNSGMTRHDRRKAIALARRKARHDARIARERLAKGK